MMRKKLIGCATVLTVVLCLIASFLAFEYFHNDTFSSLINTIWPHVPTVLKRPRIVLGEGFMAKKTFIGASGISWVTDIVKPTLEESSSDLMVIGKAGLIRIGQDGHINNKKLFFFSDPDRRSNAPRPLEGDYGPVHVLEDDSKSQLMLVSEGSIDGSIMVQADGGIRWRFGDSLGVDSLSPIDWSGNGYQFVVDYSDKKGIDIIDADGQNLGRIFNDHASSVKVIDIGESKKGAAFSDELGRLVVIDLKGKVLGKYKLPFSLTRFSLCNYSPVGDGQYGLAIEHGKIWLFDFNGTVQAIYQAPFSEGFSDARAARVKLKETEPEYLAVVANYLLIRSMFYLFDAKGNLVFQEVLFGPSYLVSGLPKSLLLTFPYQISDSAKHQNGEGQIM